MASGRNATTATMASSLPWMMMPPRWQPEFGNGKALRWFLDRLLFAYHEFSVEDSQTLVLVWLLQQFFPGTQSAGRAWCPASWGRKVPARALRRG
jgi:hypothetical protein